MNQREHDVRNQTIEQLKEEHTEHKGVLVHGGSDGVPTMFVPIISPEEKARREEAAHAANLALIQAEMAPPPVDRERLRQRLQNEQIEQMAAELRATRSTRVIE